MLIMVLIKNQFNSYEWNNDVILNFNKKFGEFRTGSKCGGNTGYMNMNM
jgi:hypothetical protein